MIFISFCIFEPNLMAVFTEFVSEYHKNQQLDGFNDLLCGWGTTRKKIYELLRRRGTGLGAFWGYVLKYFNELFLNFVGKIIKY